KDKNFHKEMMIRRGFGDAAERIQELYLAKRKDEAAAAVPDEFVDQGALIEQGTAEQIFENPSYERTRTFLSRVTGAD
ncbi:MAG: hypothetical protein K0U52_10115, partial [Gammaproteobacteria bacterium]|nr:hypothetical protein [Gammaproteobacteria bacterium]